MAKNKKGNTKAEYPKLIRVEGKLGKVRVMNADEEAKYNKPEKAEKKDAAWGKDKT